MYYTQYLPKRPKLWLVSPCKQAFPRYKFVENRKNHKWTKWPQTDIKHLPVKSTGPPRPKSWHTRLLKIGKIGNEPNDSRLTLNTYLTDKSTLYTVSTYALGPNFWSVSHHGQPFPTRLSKIGNDLEHLSAQGQTCPIYTKYLPERPHLWSVSLYDQLFLRYKVVENLKKSEMHRLSLIT